MYQVLDEVSRQTNEQDETLEQFLIQLTADYKHKGGCIIRVENAPGFSALQKSLLLGSLGITLEFGRIKNKNQNPSVDRIIQEVEQEIIRIVPNGGPISASTAIAISNANNRIRSNGPSSKEVLTKRDSVNNHPLTFEDKALSNLKYEERLKNRSYSQASKARGKPKASADRCFRGI